MLMNTEHNAEGVGTYMIEQNWWSESGKLHNSLTMWRFCDLGHR
jgi:hypothetical protein